MKNKQRKMAKAFLTLLLLQNITGGPSLVAAVVADGGSKATIEGEMVPSGGISEAEGAKGGSSQNPCNPCAPKNPCNPCNPCAPKNPCRGVHISVQNPCHSKNPCNPCGGMNPCNPCGGMNPCNPCGGGMAKGGKNLVALIEAGDALWNDNELSSNGTSCQTCHQGGLSMTPAESFPHFVTMPDRVVSLDQMINFCMVTPMATKPFAWDDERLTALNAYYTYSISGAEMPPDRHGGGMNPCNPCGGMNPCAPKNPCNPCNPCAPKNPCNPCAPTNPCNPCNPCAPKNPCNPCAPKNPCNPCAPKNPCNPCGGMNKGVAMAGLGVLGLGALGFFLRRRNK